jgi:hypothetical protein
MTAKDFECDAFAKQGSFGFQDPTRKGGSDEGEKKPKKELVRVEHGGWYFFEEVSMPFVGEYQILFVRLNIGGKVRGLVKF